MQNWYKNIFVDATMSFQLPYVQIWTALPNRDYTGFEPKFLAAKVRLRTPWTTEQTYRLWKFSKASVFKSPSILILFWSRNMIFFK